MPPHHKTLRKRPLRFVFQRWHRRLGAASALLMILAAVTGLALNHTNDLHLGSHYPQNSVLLWPYEAVLTPTYRILTDNGELSASQGQLYLEKTPLVECDSLQAFAATEAGLLVSCQGQWHLFDETWQLLESLDPALMNLTGSERLGTAAGQLLVDDSGTWVQVDTATFEVLGPVPGADVEVAARVTEWQNTSISWQRLMQDLHSGRWFGGWGIWVMDIAAVILLLLAVSGLWMWWGKRRR